MTEAAALELRHVRLAEPVTLRPAPLEGSGEEGVFVALEDSPPVRTVLAVVEGGRRRALEVVWVVEVAGGDEVKGFYGRWVADEALERAARVGTEHLEDGTPVVQPVVHDNSAVLDVSDTSMAMPAPVIVLDDDTGGVDTDEEDGEREAEDREREAKPGDDVAPRRDSEESPTVSYEQHSYSAETVSYPHPSGDAEATAPEAGAAESSGTGETAEASTDSGDASDSGDAGETAEASTDSGDASTPTKSGRKKRGRKRR